MIPSVVVYRREAKIEAKKKKRATLLEYAGDILQAGLATTIKDAFSYARKSRESNMVSRSGNIRHTGKYDKLVLENTKLRTQLSEAKSEKSKVEDRLRHLEEENKALRTRLSKHEPGGIFSE